MQRTFKRIGGILPILAAVSLVALAGMFVARFDARESLNLVRDTLLKKGTTLSIAISTEISKRAIIGDAMAETLSQFPDMSADDYTSLAEKLRGSRLDIKNIATAPNLIVSHIYPTAPNSSVLGLDYRKPSAFNIGVEEAIAQKELVLVGPVDLIQGGKGFILRVPVFTFDVSQAANVLWGVVSVVIDADAFFSLTGISSGIEDTRIAVRTSNSAMIFGGSEVFSLNAIVIPIQVGNDVWQLGLIPAAGWPTQGEHATLIWTITGIAALAIAGLMRHLNKLKQHGQTAQRLLLDAIEAIDDGFVLFDSDDRLVLYNSRMRELYGKAADNSLVGHTFRDILKAGIKSGRYPDAIGHEDAWLEEHMKAHRTPSEATEQKLANGSWLRVADKHMADGSTVGLRVDITDLKVAREAAEAANRATTEFLNNINHEIRTPLTVIAGYISFLASPEMLPSHRAMKLLLEDPDADKTALGTAAGAYVVETKSYAKRTQTSLQHLLGLVRDTLDLSKIQNGNLKIDLENVELAPVLQECAQQFAQMAEQKGLRIEYSCAPMAVRVDHNRLRQILVNVIGNSLKFTNEGHINIACKKENGRASVTVADTGCGIAEEHQQDVFKRFWQADGSVTREHGGTGLGLAISRNLVELMGGKIELQSKLGKGSVFTIWLPLAS